MQDIDSLNISSLRHLISPAELKAELPLAPGVVENIIESRQAIRAILTGLDDRLLLVIGPCSIHDPTAALEYGLLLKELITRYHADLKIVMRTYFEKPRTVRGWKGLINDPYLDNSFDINRGLYLARKLLLDLNSHGVPCGNELLDTITPQFLSDLIAWAAIGARTTESQIHRELASGLAMPVGFKNGTHGSVQVAIEAICSAHSPHHFLSINQAGFASVFGTAGNPDCHIILRGSQHNPNYDAEHVRLACEQLTKHQLPTNLMIDCSHGNSRKNHKNQKLVVQHITEQLTQGSMQISGVMIESFLLSGRQDLVPNKKLTYGQSITDACIDWDETCELVDSLAQAVRRRRQYTQRR